MTKPNDEIKTDLQEVANDLIKDIKSKCMAAYKEDCRWKDSWISHILADGMQELQLHQADFDEKIAKYHNISAYFIHKHILKVIEDAAYQQGYEKGLSDGRK